ncbi:MAG TPA: amidohydrolase [Bacillota bacterium]|nr:amidohydrolase [Bacillota bacterium]
MESRKIYKNCKIYSMDGKNSSCEAMVTEGGRIIYIGDESGADSYASNAEEVDLCGRTVLPAMCDSHVHAPGLAYDILFNLNLYPALNLDETMAMIRDHVESHSEKKIYYGRGFNVNYFQGKEGILGPRKERLDEICPDKPIIISDFGGNCMWLNTKAMEVYNITPDRECPPGGEIQLDPDTGELWGIIRNEARGFIPYPEFTDEENFAAMKYFQDILLSNGYTSVFALRPPGTVEPRTTLFDSFAVLERQGQLKLRIHGARDMDPMGDVDQQIEEMLAIKKRVDSPLMQFTTAKFFLDGVVEGLDGYLLEPYTEEAGKGKGFRSQLFWDKEKLAYAFQRCMEAGFQIHCHSIGDGATHDALDAMESAMDAAGKKDYRNSLTHLQLVAEEDIQRMAAMDVIANVQTYWHFKSPVMFPLEKKLLGERAEKEYPLGSLVRNGVTIVASSDYPVTPKPNPFFAIEAAVTRNLYDAESLGVDDIEDADDPRYLLNKDERIGLTEILRAFTSNAAYGRFQEDIFGSLEPGKSADFIVVDRDPYGIDPLDLEKVEVLATFFRGEEVYRK